MGRLFIAGNVVVLELIRSAQSGNKAMVDVIGTNLVCYTSNQLNPFMFSGGEINLSNMAAGDTITVEVHKTIVAGGGYILESQITYNNVQAIPLKHIDSIANLYGVRVRARQTAGVARTFYMEFFVSRR